MEIMSSTQLNSGFETDFELDASADNLLKIHHDDGEINREKITADRIHNTTFSCLLRTVQYGTYDKEEAALLVFAFNFGFRDKARDRFTTATIEMEFEETVNAQLEKPVPRNYNNDPAVKIIAPVQIRGNPSKEKSVNKWTLEGDLTYQIPIGLKTGIKGNFHQKVTSERQHQMWINGDMDSDDSHHYHNRVIWSMGENKVERTGILHNVPTAVVITLPKDPKHLIKVRVAVTTIVAFSMNLMRLVPKKDDPILLDRSTTTGPQYGREIDFKAVEFPWADVIRIPVEYEAGPEKPFSLNYR